MYALLKNKICCDFSKDKPSYPTAEVFEDFEQFLFRKFENGIWSSEFFVVPSDIDDMELLKAQNKALTERAEFMEDLIAEIAKKIY